MINQPKAAVSELRGSVHVFHEDVVSDEIVA
jgi:hypothetical protein